MASTTTTLTDQELAALREAAAKFKPRPGYYMGLNPSNVIRWALETGQHPCVLADPEGHRVRIERERNGLFYVKWDRPKKKGADAASGVPVGRSEQEVEWARETLASLTPRRSARTYARLVAEVAKAAGIAGRVSMRTLRHTYLTQLARKALDPAVVVQLGNVSPREAIRYTKGAAMDRDIEVFERMREKG